MFKCCILVVVCIFLMREKLLLYNWFVVKSFVVVVEVLIRRGLVKWKDDVFCFDWEVSVFLVIVVLMVFREEWRIGLIWLWNVILFKEV